MADETTESANSDVVTETATTVVEPKTQPAKRVSKTAASSAGADHTSDELAPAGNKRRKQTRAAKARPAAKEAKPTRNARQARAARAVAPQAPSEPTPPSDGMADLLQLEDENEKLRKLLAEKLRAENADLRKRLGVS